MKVHRRFCMTIMLVLCSLNQAHGDTPLSADVFRGDRDEGRVGVLQSRFFRKEYRLELGALAGTFLNESYTKTNAFGLRSSFFPSEWWGVEYQWIKTKVGNSEDRKALNSQRYKDPETDELVAPDVEVNSIHQISDLNFLATPFYGKLNFFDALIVYADVYASVGLSSIVTDQGKKVAVSMAAGQRFYLTKSTSFRLEFRDRSFEEQRNNRSTRRHAMSFDMSASYFFW